MKILCELEDYRGVTAYHYKEDRKFMVWLHVAGEPYKMIEMAQVHVKEPMNEEQLKHFIDGTIENQRKEKQCQQPE